MPRADVSDLCLGDSHRLVVVVEVGGTGQLDGQRLRGRGVLTAAGYAPEADGVSGQIERTVGGDVTPVVGAGIVVAIDAVAIVARAGDHGAQGHDRAAPVRRCHQEIARCLRVDVAPISGLAVHELRRRIDKGGAFVVADGLDACSQQLQSRAHERALRRQVIHPDQRLIAAQGDVARHVGHLEPGLDGAALKLGLHQVEARRQGIREAEEGIAILALPLDGRLKRGHWFEAGRLRPGRTRG